MRGLYIHIPFCKSICSYCDFPKIVSCEANYEIYIHHLIDELKRKKDILKNIETVYIGGGTPNVLPIALLRRLFIEITPYLDFSLESTIECNPELLTKEYADLFKEFNINRVSLGIQTIKQDSLSLLGRHHTMKDCINAISLLRKAGIENISADFIFGIPGTTLEDLKRDLSFVHEMKLPHTSFYSLILEEKTIFAYQRKIGNLKLLDDDMVADMYDLVNATLKEYGYTHYEISNYAKPGYPSIHNMLYWKCEEYVGVGMGAAEYIKPYRNTNYHTIKEYYEKGIEESIEIDTHESKNEFMMLGLRMTKGISIHEYQNRFSSDVFKDFPIQSLIDKGLLKKEEDHLFIPEDKLFIANLVYEEFVD